MSRALRVVSRSISACSRSTRRTLARKAASLRSSRARISPRLRALPRAAQASRRCEHRCWPGAGVTARRAVPARRRAVPPAHPPPDPAHPPSGPARPRPDRGRPRRASAPPRPAALVRNPFALVRDPLVRDVVGSGETAVPPARAQQIRLRLAHTSMVWPARVRHYSATGPTGINRTRGELSDSWIPGRHEA